MRREADYSLQGRTGSDESGLSSSTSILSQFFLCALGFSTGAAWIGVLVDDEARPEASVSPDESREGQFVGSDFANFSSI